MASRAARSSVPDSRTAPILAPEQRARAGKALRDRAPRETHAVFKAVRGKRDPLAILEKSNRGRMPELKPIRYGRMVKSPFTFLRGSAAVMAYDLSTTPTTGLIVQACGDCHLVNFGLFATPERNLVFDLNDFDETHPAPWEWDVKRLAASIVVAARDSGLSDSQADEAVMRCALAYRGHLRECSEMAPLDVWYKRLDFETVIENAPSAKARKFRERLAQRARERIVDHLFPKIAAVTGGQYRFVDQPPLLFHMTEDDFEERARAALDAYRASLPDDRRVLLDRYHLVDVAVKVVGIGSVGTRCFVALMMSEQNHPLMLQVKEAGRSVLEPYAKKCVYDNQGQRVVVGQRLMQSSSDIFLGWVRGLRGKEFYVRQLRDMKMSVPVEGLSAEFLCQYVEKCGWTLARAHAKSGDAAMLGAYLGKGEQFDKALAKFAVAYADQTERDHATLVKAVRSGRVEILQEE